MGQPTWTRRRAGMLETLDEAIPEANGKSLAAERSVFRLLSQVSSPLRCHSTPNRDSVTCATDLERTRSVANGAPATKPSIGCWLFRSQRQRAALSKHLSHTVSRAIFRNETTTHSDDLPKWAVQYNEWSGLAPLSRKACTSKIHGAVVAKAQAR
ncbi:hypothetical protein CSOJ01_02850 [Colletotrichum sojae]|uniref:Uncharacterized protein n=1 Tax=Colletotrichum sojae TaxID=2175907 RepID=A0A8H6JPZ2_9PEZI|nr:hypothetical protein CSOJ01_02850 [Colletotrichum sojae]